MTEEQWGIYQEKVNSMEKSIVKIESKIDGFLISAATIEANQTAYNVTMKEQRNSILKWSTGISLILITLTQVAEIWITR